MLRPAGLIGTVLALRYQAFQSARSGSTFRRYEAATGAAVSLADSGEIFEKVAARRRNDERDKCDEAVRPHHKPAGWTASQSPSPITTKFRNATK